MSEFEDNLRAILSDPAELERIASMAAELMGGAPAEEASRPETPAAGVDLLRRLKGLLGGTAATDKAALAEALSPFLRPERAARLGRALRLAGMLRVAAAAMGEEGSFG